MDPSRAGVFCNQCGHRNPSGANFCSSCGAVLEHGGDDDATTITFLPIESSGEVADEEVSVTVSDVPAGLGMLVVKRGPNAGSRFVLESDVTRAGRHPDSDIFLDDITVSRRHAQITRRGETERLSSWRCASIPRPTMIDSAFIGCSNTTRCRLRGLGTSL